MNSLVSIFDIATRKVKTSLETDDHVEAPNWMPDGNTLIVNSAGRIYKIPFEQPSLVEIESGFASMINKVASSNARSLMIEIIASFATRDMDVLGELLTEPEPIC